MTRGVVAIDNGERVGLKKVVRIDGEKKKTRYLTITPPRGTFLLLLLFLFLHLLIRILQR